MKIRQTVSGTFLMLLRITRRLWVRVALMALLAVAASVAAIFLEEYIPAGVRDRFSRAAVMPVLTILASGMLAVSTFSLNVMVTAHHAAAAQATPRAHRVLLSDTTTHTVLATFIGAFVYAFSAILLFQAGFHAPGSSVFVMGVTAIVVLLVILAMLRWIDHLSDLGSMDATLRKTEVWARSSLQRCRDAPALSATPLTDDTVIPEDAITIRAPETGYLQYLDLPALNDIAEDKGGYIYFRAPPGQFVLEGEPVADAAGLDEDGARRVQKALGMGQYRTFEQDATYGLLVLSEIASRALSPGINDPGTAIDVIARQERLIWDWANTPDTEDSPKFPRVFIRRLSADVVIESAFASTARDGANMIEVVMRLLKALGSLAAAPEDGLSDAARDMADRTRAYADKALSIEADRARIKKAPAD